MIVVCMCVGNLLLYRILKEKDMKRNILWTAVLLLLAARLPLQAIACNDVERDTITELCLHTIENGIIRFNLTDAPVITFVGDSIYITVGNVVTRFFQTDITKYTYGNRVAITRVDSTVCEDGLPFTWNGLSVNEAGVHSVSLLSTEGADSTVILTLSVAPTTYGTQLLSVVENDLPYTYNGRIYTEAVTHDTIILTSSAGCDSILDFTLFVHLNKDTSIYEEICETSLPYIWNGMTFSGAGVQSVTLDASTGADSTVTMSLTVIPTTYTPVNYAIPENQLPFEYEGRYYTSSVYDTIVLTSVSGCDSVVYFHLIVYNNQTLLFDTTVCEQVLPLVWHDSLFTEAGMKQYTLVSSTGSDSTVILTLHVIPTAYSSVVETVLENNLPHTYLGHTYFGSVSDTLTLLSHAGCDSIVYYSLTVIPNVTVFVDSTICESELPLLWNGMWLESSGTFNVTLVASTGADSTIYITLTVVPTMYADFYDTIAASELPYTFLHHVYTEAVAEDTLILVSSAGCDSILTYHLYVQDTSVSGISNCVQDVFRVTVAGNRLKVNGLREGDIVSLYSVDGRMLIRQRVCAEREVVLALDEFPAGVYLVQIIDAIYKIVKL